jgi:hypothetical protein
MAAAGSTLERKSSGTVEALHQLALKDFDHERAAIRLCNAVARGAAIGFCLRGGLHLLKFILSYLIKRKRPSAPTPLPDMLSDTLRYTSFLGAFAGIFVAVDEGIAALFGREWCEDADPLCCWAWSLFLHWPAHTPCHVLAGPRGGAPLRQARWRAPR